MGDFELFSDDVCQKVMKNFNRDNKSHTEDVKMIREWMKTQAHLPEILDDKRIGSFLRINKYNFDKTKKKIDLFYTVRHVIPEFFINPKEPKLQKTMDMMYCVYLPKLTPDLYRIIIIQIRDKNLDEFDPVACIALSLNFTEIRLLEDVCVGDIAVFDIKNFTLNDIRKFTPVLLKKLHTMIQGVYSSRFKAIHFINVPTYADTLISFVKALFKPKIANRIFSHRKLDTFYEQVPKELLPKDYGGDQLSLDELQENIRKKFVQYENYFDYMETLRVDESLRPEKLKNDELLGFYGNFRKLDVD